MAPEQVNAGGPAPNKAPFPPPIYVDRKDDGWTDGLAKPAKPNTIEPILQKIAGQPNPFGALAERLLTTPGDKHETVANFPIGNARFNPLYLSLTRAGHRMLSGITWSERQLFQEHLILLGADPFVRGPRGQCAVLTRGFLANHSLIKFVVRHHGEQLSRNLTRQEKMWFYCGCFETLTKREDPATADLLFEKLFEVNPTTYRSGESFRTLEHHFLNSKSMLCERLVKSMWRLVSQRVLTKEEASLLLNTTYNRDGGLLVHTLASQIGNIENALPLFLRLGGNLSARTSARHVTPGRTAWHIAAVKETIAYLRKHVPPRPGDLLIADSNGDTPLHAYLSNAISDTGEAIKVLTSEISVLRCRNREGFLPLDLALKRNHLSLILRLIDLGAPVGEDLRLQERLAFMESNTGFFREASHYARSIALKAFNAISPEERPIFLTAFSESVRAHRVDGWRLRGSNYDFLAPSAPATTLARHMPLLLAAKTSQPIQYLGEIFDGMATALGGLEGFKGRGFHPNESELLLMLARPGLIQEGGQALRGVVFGLTSTRRFDRNRVNYVFDEVLNFWADLGKVGFEFLNLKFDARRFIDSDGTSTTLLEKYGFTRHRPEAPARRTLLSLFRSPDAETSTPALLLRGSERDGAVRFRRIRSANGWKLVAQTLDRDTEIELNKTHIRVFHPAHGELVVRNSSPEGGRMSLLHPAYIISAHARAAAEGKDAPHGLKRRWSFREIEKHFHEILKPSLYPAGALGPEVKGGQFLLNQLRTALRDYRAWCCDMSEDTAYLDDLTGERFLVGGYKSPGFPVMLRALRYWASLGEGVELAFCKREFPAWSDYDKIAIDSLVVSELERLSRGDFSSPLLYKSGVHTFFQSGFNSFGDLIVRSGTTNRESP